MILCRAPLRITFGGGSTDLPNVSEKMGGICLSAAINKYSYVAINRTFMEGIILKYSELEKVKSVEEIKHPMFREAIRLLDFKTPQIEVVSVADVPSNGAGLGNSGSFLVSLLKALFSYRRIPMLPEYLAETACDISMKKLGRTQGKQDEYICALGGIQVLEFEKWGEVIHYPLSISYDTMNFLEENLMLFYTGISHNSDEILKEQSDKIVNSDKDMLDNAYKLKDIALRSKKALEVGNVREFGVLMNEQYFNKRERTPKNSFLEETFFDLMDVAWGAKIIGSGSGGFYLCLGTDKSGIRKVMQKRGMQEMKFSFDFEGVKQII
jgi:D-glycero-alpha-D-manno-heptose-7-phosphate kinase